MPNKTKEASDTAEIYNGNQGYGPDYRNLEGLTFAEQYVAQHRMSYEELTRENYRLIQLLGFIFFPSFSTAELLQEVRDPSRNLYYRDQILATCVDAGSVFIVLQVILELILGDDLGKISPTELIRYIEILAGLRYIGTPLLTPVLIKVRELLQESPEADLSNVRYSQNNKKK